MLTEEKHKALSVKQLDAEAELTDSQYREIAGLIYDTDEYIFPALFEGCRDQRKAAGSVISHILKKGSDHLFCKDNLYVCMLDGHVAGMILWYRGTMDWDHEDFVRSAAETGICLKIENAAAVDESFFGSTEESDPAGQDLITLAYVCVDKASRGHGIGSFMIRSFISEFEKQEMYLCVLKDNGPAIKLYENNGFEIVSEYPGFSLSDEKPACYGMRRKASGGI